VSSYISQTILGDSPRPLPVLRWLALVALLIAEVLGLTIRFDAASFAQDHEWWSWLVLQVHFLPQLGSGIAIAVVVFGGAELAGEIRRASGQRRRSDFFWFMLAAHLLAFAGFTALSAVILEGDIRATQYPGAWVLSWLCLGLVTVLFWVGTLLSPTLWLHLVKKSFGTLLVAVVVGFAALEAGRFTTALWEPLGRATLQMVHVMLAGFCEPIKDLDNFVIGTDRFWVEIAAQCSGYEGIGLIWVFLLFFLWHFRREIRFPQALLLLPLGTAVMWLANAVRITLLIAVGTWIDPQVAMAGFHSQAGWLTFNAVALGLLALLRHSRLSIAERGVSGETSEMNQPSASAFLAPLFATLATVMITLALSGNKADFHRLYPLRVVAAALILWQFRKQYAQFDWSCSWQAIALGGVAFAIWLGLEPTQSDSLTMSVEQHTGLLPGWAEAWLAFRVLGTVVAVPLVEELAFRGYLTRRLIATDFSQVPLGQFSWFSFLASSAIFGALHSRWLAGTLAGMVYAVALYRRGRLADAVWAHATTNALISVYVLMTSSWALWE
jgi:exosortase E/protease (VPEID-CTERM system)